MTPLVPFSSPGRSKRSSKFDFGDDIALPFADQRTIDMRRCCSILHVSSQVVHRLRVTPIMPDSEEMCLKAYNTLRSAPLRIDYASVVRFLDHLRELHSITDRRPPLSFGRHRDDDLLPFSWSDTITVEETSDVLNLHRSKVLLRIEAGRFEAYQLVRSSPWRISRSSLARYVATFTATQNNVRPYGAREISQGEVR